MNYQTLLFETPEPGLGLNTLNRPDRLNAMSLQMLDDLYALYGELEKDDQVRVLILTGSGEIDFGHPVFRSDVQPMIFTSDRTAARKLAAAPYPVVADEAPDIRRAIQHLRTARECECVSIEAGPSTARSLYETPMVVKELLLSIYLERPLDERAKGEPLVQLAKIRQMFASETSATHRDQGQHWSFYRLRR